MSTELHTEIPSASGERAMALYRLMSKVHHGDKRVRKALSSGEAAMSYWPVDGQEAMSAGAMLALADGDQLVTTYRGLGDVLAKGVDLRGYFAEILGRRDGLSRGKAGAMGIHDPAHGIAWTTGIVGAGPLIANGIALAADLRKTGQVVLVSFGDGATSIGYVHEAMNMAALWSLPVVFFCQNNFWAECTSYGRYTRTERLSDRAAGYGMPGTTRMQSTTPLRRQPSGHAPGPGRRSSRPSHIACKDTTSATRWPMPTRKSSPPCVPIRRSRVTANASSTRASPVSPTSTRSMPRLSPNWTRRSLRQWPPRHPMPTNSIGMYSAPTAPRSRRPVRCMPACPEATPRSWAWFRPYTERWTARWRPTTR